MMTDSYKAKKANLDFLHARALSLKESLQLEAGGGDAIPLEELAGSIAGQFKLEEETMEKIGLTLTPIHLTEHRKMLREISLLEFSWKARRISDEVYIKALNYKLEFHNHYFDKAQLLSFVKKHRHSS